MQLLAYGVKESSHTVHYSASKWNSGICCQELQNGITGCSSWVVYWL